MRVLPTYSLCSDSSSSSSERDTIDLMSRSESLNLGERGSVGSTVDPLSGSFLSMRSSSWVEISVQKLLSFLRGRFFHLRFIYSKVRTLRGRMTSPAASWLSRWRAVLKFMLLDRLLCSEHRKVRGPGGWCVALPGSTMLLLECVDYWRFSLFSEEMDALNINYFP